MFLAPFRDNVGGGDPFRVDRGPSSSKYMPCSTQTCSPHFGRGLNAPDNRTPKNIGIRTLFQVIVWLQTMHHVIAQMDKFLLESGSCSNPKRMFSAWGKAEGSMTPILLQSGAFWISLMGFFQKIPTLLREPKCKK